MKYKVGDIVVITKNSKPYFTKGKKAVITHVGRVDYTAKELENPYSNMSWFIVEDSMKLVEPIDEQTIMFWNLQLQFMEMSQYTLYSIFRSLEHRKLYVRNKYSKRALKLLSKVINGSLDENQRYCLATHLALNLSGLIDE